MSTSSECDYCHRLYPHGLVRQRTNGKKMCVECRAGDQPPDDDEAVQTLSLSQETVWAVSEYLGDRTEGPLFQSLRTPGKRMNRGDVQAIVKYYAKKAGITKRVTPHSFRHSFVTLSLNAGVSHRDVQISAGHADGRMTTYYDRMTTYYDHGSDNRAREATHALTAFVNEML